MTTTNEWRVYCIDEGQFVYGLLTDPAVCTACFNNNTHTINENSISITKTIKDNVVLISTNDNKNIGGNYVNDCDTITITEGVNVVTTYIRSYPIDIGILSFSLDLTLLNIDDYVNIHVRPKNDSPVGVLSGNVNINDTTVNVGNASVYFKKGFLLVLRDSNGVKELLEIKSISGNVLTLVTAVTKNYTPGNYISVLIKRINNYTFKNKGYRYFANFLRTAAFSPNLEAVVEYVNVSGEAKTFTYGMEYLY